MSVAIIARGAVKQTSSSTREGRRLPFLLRGQRGGAITGTLNDYRDPNDDLPTERWLAISFVGQAAARRRTWPSSYQAGPGHVSSAGRMQLRKSKAPRAKRAKASCLGPISWLLGASRQLLQWANVRASCSGLPWRWDMADVGKATGICRPHRECKGCFPFCLSGKLGMADGDEFGGVMNRRCPLVGNPPPKDRLPDFLECASNRGRIRPQQKQQQQRLTVSTHARMTQQSAVSDMMQCCRTPLQRLETPGLCSRTRRAITYSPTRALQRKLPAEERESDAMESSWLTSSEGPSDLLPRLTK